MAKFEIYKDKQGEWRWRFKADNGYDIIADSGEGYINKYDCQRAIDLVKNLASNAEVEEVEEVRETMAEKYRQAQAQLEELQRLFKQK
jgi:uncharacterized protein YegP (UPF0339 family)